MTDSLLAASLWICRHYGVPQTESTFLSGLPTQHRLAPHNAKRAFDGLGIAMREVTGPLDETFELLFPVVYQTKRGSHLVVTAREQRGDETVYRVLDPETKSESDHGITEVPWSTLRQELTDRYYIFKKSLFQRPEFRADKVTKEDLFRLFWTYRQYLGNAVLASFITNVLMTFTGLFVMTVYDRVIPYQAYSTLWVLASAVILATIFQTVGAYVGGRLVEVASKKMDFLLGNDSFAKALYMKLEYKPESTGFFVGQLQMYQQFREFFSGLTMTILIDLPFSIIFVIITFVVAGQLALVPLIAILLSLVILTAIQIPLNRVIKELNNTGFAAAGVMFESMDGVETLRSVGTEGYMQNRFEGIHAHVSTLQLRQGMLSGLASSVSSAIQGLQLVAIVIWGVYLIGNQELSLGALFAAVMFSGRAMGPWAQVPALMSKISFIGLAVKITLDILNLPSVKSKSARYLNGVLKSGSVGVKDIEFSYPAIAGQANSPTLRNVTFEIKAGEKVAFIGRMGSGKSTLLRIIGGLYSPTKGSIAFDGLDCRQIDPIEVRERVGFVSQEVRLFSGTLRSNILMGRNNISEERFLETCKLTGVDELAEKHPKGYDQPIGEGGRGLSGGQRQLVSLARTLITDPLVLLMDEPTSAMDLQSEKAFVQKLAPLVAGRTLIVVTHRPQILQILDRIVVMEQGKVYADGPKDKVLALISAKKKEMGETLPDSTDTPPAASEEAH